MGGAELLLCEGLPYPIIISSLDLEPPAEVERSTRLLTYSFKHKSSTTGVVETRFGTWDSPIDCKLESWTVKPGDLISSKCAVAMVQEPCKHDVQVGGLCAVCGKDMTDFDYTGYSDTSRAHIQMTHSANGPTVSLEEAQRLERETAKYLAQSRKLSLIVDLDQTIVHATVDPTVGEWITDGEAWDAKHQQGGLSTEDAEVNPNWEALKDVKKFTLGTETVPTHGPRAQVQGCIHTSNRQSSRPGLQDFLQKMNEKYEMHVYTMGTRAYAEAVCAAIDPAGNFFRDRILSRDESGSLTQKSLQRLFPCDTSMVVIIDDRADVWEWSPNLIKVRPYDFFVGIGDINSTFLPKAPSLVPSAPPISPIPELPAPEPTAKEADAALATQNRMTIARIAAQVEERPLARKQEELLEESPTEEIVKRGGDGTEEVKTERVHTATKKALLKNDDTELLRVSNLLEKVHERFYDAYDSCSTDSEKDKSKTTKANGRPSESPMSYDVKNIIPQIRAATLAGTHLVFSSVIPLNVEPATSEIWRTAEVFGATCHMSVTNRVTHVVAAKRGTVKVDEARRRGTIHIVRLAWFLDSLALWERQDESAYLLDADEDGTGVTSTPRPMHVSPIEEELAQEPEQEISLNDADMWADANAEVDAVLEETEDEADLLDEEDGEGGGSTRSAASSSYRSKKRSRSSSVGLAGDEDAASPLAKRKRLSEARRGSSRLKVGMVAGDLDVTVEKGSEEDDKGSKRSDQVQDDDSTTSADGYGANDTFDDDDFLARELEEEEEEEEEGG
ncbi:hypothetical protein BU17DRAFT_48885 [Hysterangium stoloniferum]|nr:hypothetical protein BU17DRAFT_48885 [Hysterangium stoloniferum]